jgi:hypothetical protein
MRQEFAYEILYEILMCSESNYKISSRDAAMDDVMRASPRSR